MQQQDVISSRDYADVLFPTSRYCEQTFFCQLVRPARLEADLQQRRESRPRHQYDLCQRISCCYYGSQDKIHRIYHQNVDMVVIKSPNYETELRNDSSSIPTASSTKEVILNMDNTNAAKQNAICKD
jgi:hypothetical protein